jgi:hypothetical protein
LFSSVVPTIGSEFEFSFTTLTMLSRELLSELKRSLSGISTMTLGLWSILTGGLIFGKDEIEFEVFEGGVGPLETTESPVGIVPPNADNGVVENVDAGSIGDDILIVAF